MAAKISAQKYQNRSKTPGLLALAALLVIIGTAVLVMVLAGGNQTGDGTGRGQLANVGPVTVTTSVAGSGAAGPAR